MPAFLAEAWAEAPRRPLIRDLMGRRFDRGVTVNAILLQECVNAGELRRDLDVDDLARTFAALLDGMVLEYVTTGGSLRRVDVERRLQLVLDGARPVAGA